MMKEEKIRQTNKQEGAAIFHSSFASATNKKSHDELAVHIYTINMIA
jgi:hypothetical protein